VIHVSGEEQGNRDLGRFLACPWPSPSMISRFLGFALLLPAFSGEKGGADTSFSMAMLHNSADRKPGNNMKQMHLCQGQDIPSI